MHLVHLYALFLTQTKGAAPPGVHRPSCLCVWRAANAGPAANAAVPDGPGHPASVYLGFDAKSAPSRATPSAAATRPAGQMSGCPNKRGSVPPRSGAPAPEDAQGRQACGRGCQERARARARRGRRAAQPLAGVQQAEGERDGAPGQRAHGEQRVQYAEGRRVDRARHVARPAHLHAARACSAVSLCRAIQIPQGWTKKQHWLVCM